MSIHAIIFDRDNTLLRFDRGAVRALEARAAALLPGLEPGALARHWAAWPGPWPRAEPEEPAFWRAFWRTLAEQHGAAARAAELEMIGAFYHTCFAAHPDAAACVAAVRARGLRTAVLTNFELPSVAQTLAAAGIDPRLFDALLSSASLGFRKPDPRAYLAALNALGLPADACLLVDDLPENVAGAEAVGMRAVLLDRESAHAAHTPRITRLSDLPGAIDAL